MGMKPRPKDPNQLAKLIVDIATGEASDEPAEPDASESAKKPGKGKKTTKKRKGLPGGRHSA